MDSRYRGGRVGMYVFSQTDVVFSRLHPRSSQVRNTGSGQGRTGTGSGQGRTGTGSGWEGQQRGSKALECSSLLVIPLWVQLHTAVPEICIDISAEEGTEEGVQKYQEMEFLRMSTHHNAAQQ